MLPAPINPTLSTLVLRRLAGRRELAEFAVDAIRRRFPFQHDDPIAERHGRFGLEREVQLLAPVAEHLLAERVRREQPVAARVPVRRMAWILRVIDDRDRDRLLADPAGE